MYTTSATVVQVSTKTNIIFFNLCHHQKDFNIKAQWSFFATSHGKSECDGIGGTVKRLARKESLQRHLDRHITTAKSFFDFCVEKIQKIIFHFIERSEVNSVRVLLTKRFEGVKTLPGTRSFHNFVPIDSSGTIEAKE